ncbi:MAG: hypothetical protein OXI81_16450 [Paracoccaceae bacterium]|nr:hypothetical protein [Paracoccaceae bacterium]
MQDVGFITEWEFDGETNRHNYAVSLEAGRTAITELKGCLDGNNTNIFERPSNANEFIIWSICTNTAADLRHNACTGIHIRQSAESISREQCVDGMVIWDIVCGTIGGPCPKSVAGADRETIVGTYSLPPPRLYVPPSKNPSLRNYPLRGRKRLSDVQILRAFNDCFQCMPKAIKYASIDVAHRGADTFRTPRIVRDDALQRDFDLSAIRRSQP